MKPTKPIESLILTLRNQKVILDADLADVYGVPTKALNQAVKRNADRFPEDFRFQLTTQEWAALKSQNVTSSPEGAEDPVAKKMRSQIMTASQGGRRKRPPAFTDLHFPQFIAVAAPVAIPPSLAANPDLDPGEVAALALALERTWTEHQRCANKPALGKRGTSAALGIAFTIGRALKGRDRACRPFRAWSVMDGFPRALPWAGLSPGLWP